MLFSFGEIALITLVSLAVLKPSDIPNILRQIYGARRYLTKLSSGILSSINTPSTITPSESSIENKSKVDSSAEDAHNMNFYLEKILELNGKYDGEYSIESIKAHYHQLLLKKTTEKKDGQSNNVEKNKI
jgi:Sec-independent protein translocase protein TatA